MYKYVASCVQIISTRIKNPYKVITYFIKTLVKHNASFGEGCLFRIAKCAISTWAIQNRQDSQNWWVWLELNQRPHPYQGCALTNWATDPLACSFYFAWRCSCRSGSHIQMYAPFLTLASALIKTKITSQPQKLISLKAATIGIDWWSYAGSNRRPLECKSSALPAEL